MAPSIPTWYGSRVGTVFCAHQRFYRNPEVQVGQQGAYPTSLCGWSLQSQHATEVGSRVGTVFAPTSAFTGTPKCRWAAGRLPTLPVGMAPSIPTWYGSRVGTVFLCPPVLLPEPRSAGGPAGCLPYLPVRMVPSIPTCYGSRVGTVFRAHQPGVSA
jgi:hypothetical protein